MKIEINDLHEYLKEHRDSIDYVSLEWIQTRNYAMLDTKYYGSDGNGGWDQLYARFRYDLLDLEYSFFGTVQEAIDWTKGYNHWDGCTFEIGSGVVIGYYENENPEPDLCEDDPEVFNDEEVHNIKFLGLYYFYGRGGGYGPYRGGLKVRIKEIDGDEAIETVCNRLQAEGHTEN